MGYICTAENNACQHGGVCKTFPDKPEDNFCECPPNTIGGRCHSILPPKENSVCNTNGDECLNGGTCVAGTEVVDGVTLEANYCDCPIGTYGDVCHNEPPKDSNGNNLPGISVCTPEGKECLNGGTCAISTEIVDGKAVSANKCVCPLDTFGDLCHNQVQKDEKAAAAAEAAAAEQAANDKAANQDLVCTKDGFECQNGGWCVTKEEYPDIVANYCSCPPNHTGNRCHGTPSKEHLIAPTTPPKAAPSSTSSKNKPPTSSSNKVCEDHSDCKNGGECIHNPENKCKCPTGFYGANCEKSVCNGLNGEGEQCKNGGVCVLASDQKDGSPVNYCSCPDGTSGKQCERVDSCSLQCEHGSSCRHNDDVSHGNDGNANTDFCECVGNYKGKLCDIPFEKCPKGREGQKLECLWGGKCVDAGAGEFKCDCPDGRSGLQCENGAVSNIPDWNGNCFQDEDCQNGGLCVSSHDAKETEKTGMSTKYNTCLCSLGWGGDNCETRCNSLNCQHGSSCRFPSADDISHANDTPETGAYCDCGDLPFKGKECEIAVAKCPDGTECLFGGECIGSVEDEDGDFYQCACPPGRTGNQCEYRDQTWKGDDNAYEPHVPTGNSKNQLTGTGGSSPLEMDLNIIVVSVLSALFLLAIPIALMCLKKNRDKKKAGIEDIANECLEGMEDTTSNATSETDSKTNGNGHTNGNGTNGEIHEEDLFDYDGDGVVNVNLDENEPVPLPKDKQIV